MRTITLQATDPNNAYAAFNNLDDGIYMVCTTHACQSVQNDIEVKINAAFNPNVALIVASSCRGDQTTLYFSFSYFLFDISWYQLDTAGQCITSSPLGFQRTFSRTITETTTFQVEYKLKSNIGCGAPPPMTKTITVILPKDTPPPIISGCPSDIIVIADAGKCSKKVSWTEPTATDTCFDDTSTCTFKEIVQSRALEMIVNARYTNGAGAAVTQLSSNDEFIYEISYQNTG